MVLLKNGLIPVVNNKDKTMLNLYIIKIKSFFQLVLKTNEKNKKKILETLMGS